MTTLLKQCYPEHEWLPWKFPWKNSYFGNTENKRTFVKWIESKLEIKSPEDWYNVNLQDIANISGVPLFVNISLPKILGIVYPGVKWEFNKYGGQNTDPRTTMLCSILSTQGNEKWLILFISFQRFFRRFYYKKWS